MADAATYSRASVNTEHSAGQYGAAADDVVCTLRFSVWAVVVHSRSYKTANYATSASTAFSLSATIA